MKRYYGVGIYLGPQNVEDVEAEVVANKWNCALPSSGSASSGAVTGYVTGIWGQETTIKLSRLLMPTQNIPHSRQILHQTHI